MKPINEMNLQECLGSIRKGNYLGRHELADRIEELNRWISVDERWPETEDVQGRVLVYSTCGRYWKTIDGPEGN
jgi:hypothetical protein